MEMFLSLDLSISQLYGHKNPLLYAHKQFDIENYSQTESLHVFEADGLLFILTCLWTVLQETG